MESYFHGIFVEMFTCVLHNNFTSIIFKARVLRKLKVNCQKGINIVIHET